MLNQPFFAKVEENLAENFWKITENTFQNFPKKISDFFGDCCDFRGVIFATRKEKNI